MGGTQKRNGRLIKVLQTLQDRFRPEGIEGEPNGPGKQIPQYVDLLLGILNSLHETGIVGFDDKGKYLFVQCPPDLERRYRMKADEVVGKSLADIFPPEEAEVRIRELKGLFETGESRREEYLFRTAGGDFWHDISLCPMRGPSGEVLMVIGFIRDVTARKHAEEELEKYGSKLEQRVRERTADLTEANRKLQREITERTRAEEDLRVSEEKYRFLIENANHGIVVIQDGMPKFVNPKCTEILGFSSQELTSRPFQEFLHPDDRQWVAERHQKRLRGDALPHTYSFRVVDRDGETRWLEANAVIIDWDGRSATLTFLNDITERKQAEETLEQRTKEQEVLLSSMPAFVYYKDTDLKLIAANKAFAEMVNTPIDQLPGKDAYDLFPKNQAEAFHSADKKVMESGKPIMNIEEKFTDVDGKTRWASTSKVPYFDKKGKIAGMVGITLDITERKRLEARLLWSQKMESIGRLAGGVAHDFNNLLTIIQGNTDLAMMEPYLGDRIKQNLEETLKASARAAWLTRQLLVFSRRQVTEPRVIDLNDVLLDADKMLRRLIGEDIELVTLPNDRLGRVKADPAQIEQVLLNLAVNARDAMPEGGKLILETANATLDEEYASWHVAVTPGEYVMFAVTDTGVGMTEDVKANLFEPFFTTKGVGKGTGLGLATCYGIAKDCGGNIWAYSEPGKGTTFKVYLPRVEGEAEPLPRHNEMGYLPGGTETVLLVEDEPQLRNMVSQLLSEQGYTVFEAGTGEEALRVAGEHAGREIHLLMTDVVMPQMGGKALADRLKAERPEVRVIFFSGYPDEAIGHQGVLEPGVFFFQKPFSAAVLVRKVREVLDMAEC